MSSLSKMIEILPSVSGNFRSSLIWVHTVCLYAKCKFEKFARRCSRRHKQMTFSDADFLGALRVKWILKQIEVSRKTENS